MRTKVTHMAPPGGKQIIDPVKWHRTSVTVQVSDTDYGGGVYHGRYFSLYHQARDQFMADLGVTALSLMRQDLVLSVVELHTFFVKPVFYGDLLEIRTRFLWLGNRSMGMAQEMFGTDSETGDTTLRNRVEINIVCSRNGKAMTLPENLITAIKTFYDI